MNYLYLILGRDHREFYVYFDINTFKVLRIIPDNVFDKEKECNDIYTNLYFQEAQRHIDLYSAQKAKEMLNGTPL